MNFFSGSQILFNFIVSENIQSQTEKPQNSLMPALHVRSQCIMGQTWLPRLWRFISIKYLPFIVKMGKCVFSDKWKANQRVKA